jgi:hypothetical protein
MVENDVCMVDNRTILFAKRFRSKASLAASLSPRQFANRRGIGFDFLPTPHYVTQSLSKGGRGGDYLLSNRSVTGPSLMR